MTSRTTTARRINKSLSALGSYHPEVPLNEIFECVNAQYGTPVQEDGTPWQGMLCGAQGQTTIPVVWVDGSKPMYLHLLWYKMDTRTGYRYEIVAYIS